MSDYIQANLQRMGVHYQVDKSGNIIARKGAPIAGIIAHMDTVHRIHAGQSLVPVNVNGKITGVLYPAMVQSGIGGDDKAGIWVALQSIERCPDVLAVFTVEEETGCVGARSLDLDVFAGLRFLIQFDRRGRNDIAVSYCGSPTVSPAWLDWAVPWLRESGHDTQVPGGMTDVLHLAERGVGCSCINFSAGYYNPHRDDEYICLATLGRCVRLGEKLIRGADTAPRDEWNTEPVWRRPVPAHRREWFGPDWSQFDPGQGHWTEYREGRKWRRARGK
jgi:di/tripeptidase